MRDTLDVIQEFNASAEDLPDLLDCRGILKSQAVQDAVEKTEHSVDN